MGRTTYNVGTITGGTSVNTIAQHAEMLYEYRSDNRESLAIMQKHFEAAIEFYRTKGIQVKVTLVGNRPCTGDVDPEKHQILFDRAAKAIRNHYKMETSAGSGSTDCNIPLSMGIPAVCVGIVKGVGAHTREEYVEIDSIEPGQYVAFEMIMHHF
jgi:di/tripeptidase